jgi:hypothetical protein
MTRRHSTHARSEIFSVLKGHSLITLPMEEGNLDQDLYVAALLDRIENDRAHAEAQKLLQRGEEMRANGRPDGTATIGYVIGGALVVEALAMDPYETRDGQLVRKSDGKPVTI